MEKQTAVEWLEKEVILISNSKKVSREEMIELYNQAIKQAKEMEKANIIQSFTEGEKEVIKVLIEESGFKIDKLNKLITFNDTEDGEEYYNNRFGSHNSTNNSD